MIRGASGCWELFGIHSYTYECGMGYPGVGTRISSYRDYIDEYVWVKISLTKSILPFIFCHYLKIIQYLSRNY